MHVDTYYVAPSVPELPPLALQITQLADSYMIWAGTTSLPPDNVSNAPLHGSLAKDWACAMPPRPNETQSISTSLLGSSKSDIACSMAQRLARRFKKQIFLSLDVPAGDPIGYGSGRILLEVEKSIVQKLKASDT